MAAEQSRLFWVGTGKPDQAGSDQARLLAREIDRLVAASPEKAHQLPGLIERAARKYADDHVSSPPALIRTMFTNEPVRPVEIRRSNTAPPRSAAPSKAPDPRLAAEPAWASQPAEVQAVIVILLDELERLGPKANGRSWIKYYAGRDDPGYRLVAAKRPELSRIAELGWNFYLEEQTSDAAGE